MTNRSVLSGTGRQNGDFMHLKLRAKEECTYDAVSLGEVMLRLDPGEGRIRTARQFRVSIREKDGSGQHASSAPGKAAENTM